MASLELFFHLHQKQFSHGKALSKEMSFLAAPLSPCKSPCGCSLESIHPPFGPAHLHPRQGL